MRLWLQGTTMKERDQKRLKKLGAHLKKLRKNRGLSIRQLAALCDVDYAKISKIESTGVNMNVTTLMELADGLEVTPKDLLDFEFS